MVNKRLFLFFVLFLLVLPFVFSQPPQTASTTAGLDIRFPQQHFIKQGQGIEAHTHVFNQSDGMLLTNETVSCLIHMYNESGNHVLQQDLDFSSNGIDFEVDINGTVLGELGDLSYIIQCNTSHMEGQAGGFVSGLVTITVDGRDNSLKDTTAGISISLFILSITAFLVIIPFVKKKFSKNVIANLIIKRGIWIIASYSMVLNSAIMYSIAAASGLELSGEFTRFIFFFGLFGWLGLIFLMFKTLSDLLSLTKGIAKKTKFGDLDDEEN